MKNIKKLIFLPFRKYIVVQLKCLAYMLIYTVSSLMFPSFVSIIIDEGVVKSDLAQITLYSMIMLLVGGIMIIFHYLQQISFFKLAQDIIANLKETIFQKLLNTNAEFWIRNSAGDIFAVLEKDVNQLENLLTSTISQILVDFFVTVGIAVYLLYMNREIGFIVLVLAVAFSVLQRLLGNKGEKTTGVLRSNLGELTAYTNEALNNMNSIQVSGYSGNAKKRYIEKNRNVISSFVRQVRIMNLSSCTGMGFNVLGIFIVLIIGANSVFAGKLSIGVLFALTIYVQRLYGPIIGLGNAYVSIKNSKPIIRKILSVIENTNVISNGDIKPVELSNGNIRFENVTFSYDDNIPLLDKCNVDINGGEIVGVIGENGSGKTTMVKLLTKLCESQAGHIFLDDIDIKNLDNEYLREQIGYMIQDEFILSGSLREVLDPNKNFSDTELEKIMAKFHLKISNYSKGFDTKIVENKNGMSGGEAQKIALTRLFLENKPIYVLDEPTAALDIETEADICELLQILLKDKTSIIITHRECILHICTKVIKITEMNGG